MQFSSNNPLWVIFDNDEEALVIMKCVGVADPNIISRMSPKIAQSVVNSIMRDLYGHFYDYLQKR